MSTNKVSRTLHVFTQIMLDSYKFYYFSHFIMRETKVQEGRQCISSHIVTMWLSQDSNPSSLPAKTCSELPTKPIPWHQQECA